MSDLPKNNDTKEIDADTKVKGSVLFRSLSPEDRKKVKAIAKKKAREQGLIINIIEK